MNRITKEDLAELGTGTIEREPRIELAGTTVILEFKQNGRITKRYHRYQTRAKAEAQYEWWRSCYAAGIRDDQ